MTETSFITFILGFIGGSVIGLIIVIWLLEMWGSWIYSFLDATLGYILDKLGL